MPSSLDILKNLESPVNMDYLASLAPSDQMTLPDGSKTSIAGTPSYERDQNRFLSLLPTSSPAVAALIHENEARDYGQAADLANLQSGVPGEIASAEGDVRNIAHAKQAEGEFYTYPSYLHDRNMEDRAAQAESQYIIPSVMKANADRDAATIGAEGRVAAAQAGHPQLSAIDYFRQALRDAFAHSNGAGFSPEDVKSLLDALQSADSGSTSVPR